MVAVGASALERCNKKGEMYSFNKLNEHEQKTFALSVQPSKSKIKFPLTNIMDDFQKSSNKTNTTVKH